MIDTGKGAYKYEGKLIHDTKAHGVIAVKDVIKVSSFNNLSKMEKTSGFKENPSKEKFFRKGLVDEWKKSLSSDLILKIEESFKKEMKELNYL